MTPPSIEAQALGKGAEHSQQPDRPVSGVRPEDGAPTESHEQLTADERRKLADAAQENNTNAVRLMLEAGWPVDARGQHNATPLHWAGFHGNAAMARLLLQHGAPLDVKDGDHDGTPLGWAIHGAEHGWHRKTGAYPETIEILRAAGGVA